MGVLTVEKNYNSKIANAYRLLRTNLQYNFLGKNNKTITITSAQDNDGKSTVCGNLALSFSQTNKSVLVIDCNLRKPSIYKEFEMGNELGLAEILASKENIDKSIKEYNSKLHVITAGDMPVNPTEMLCSSDVNELLESMKKIYDVILIDTPSLNEFADAQVLASQSDGVILVAKIGNTKKRNITEAIEKLHNVKANIVGGILNSDY